MIQKKQTKPVVALLAAIIGAVLLLSATRYGLASDEVLAPALFSLSEPSDSSPTTDAPNSSPTNTPFNTITKVVAFGDSITRGYAGVQPYPAKLAGMVSSCHTVVNSGVSGERTGTGINRINTVLSNQKPQFILIMEGANDAFWGVSPATVKFNLGLMVDRARAKGARPILSTITPNTRNPGVTASIPNAYNPQIKTLASQKSVTLVDNYAALAPNWANLSLEGLHPNDAGSQLIAQRFSAALSCSDSGSGGGGCFIATAAFGSAVEPQVERLKRFRDQYLLPHKAGRFLVGIYYQYSPPVAQYISSRDNLKAAVRLALYPLLGFSYLVLEASLLEQLAVIFMVVGGAGFALWMFSRWWTGKRAARSAQPGLDTVR